MNYRNVRINTVAALVLSLSAAAFFAFGRLFFGVGGWLIFYSIPAGLFVALLLIALWFIPVRGGKAGLEAGLFKSFGWRESWAFIAVTVFLFLRLPSFSGHPTCTDVVSVGEDVHCESTTPEVHASVSA